VPGPTVFFSRIPLRLATKRHTGGVHERRFTPRHIWPQLKKRPTSAAFRGGVDVGISHTISDRFRPSSRVSRLISRPATSMTCRPTSVEPVNAMRRTLGWRSSSSPTSAPEPVTTFTVPGAVVSCRQRRSLSESIRRFQGGEWRRRRRLDPMVLPAASAGPSLVPSGEREIPGDDRAAHADRLAYHHPVHPLLRQRHIAAAHLGRQTCVELQAMDQVVNLEIRRTVSCPAPRSAARRFRQRWL